MTTSITDARFTHLHATRAHIIGLLTDESPETGWGVMPGFDEDVRVPVHLEPPRVTDDTLPSQIHPSYPYGRPKRPTTKGSKPPRAKVGSHLGPELDGDEKWSEINASALLEVPDGREVPPVMAGSKRPPSPPSPALRPYHVPPPRSAHLRRHLERRQLAPPAPADAFDAPVPNETYLQEDPDSPGHQHAESPAN